MSMQDICIYLNSLPEKIDDLPSEYTLPFFMSFYGPNQIDTPLALHFHNFVLTIKSLKCWIDTCGNIQLSFRRVFSYEESLSMKLSGNIEAFVWALGYHSFGCGLDVSVTQLDPELKTKKEALYFLQTALQETHPYVRTLQSLSFHEALTEPEYIEYMNYIVTDNPSFENPEKLTRNSHLVSNPDPFFYDEDIEKVDGFYSGPSEKHINSFIFTSCLKYLEENSNLYEGSERLKVRHGVLIHNQLGVRHTVLFHLLHSVFSDLGRKSSRIDRAIRACSRFIGIAFRSPLNCEANIELLCDFHLAVLGLKKKKYSKHCNCRACVEFDAGYQACLFFVDRAVLTFQTVKGIEI